MAEPATRRAKSYRFGYRLFLRVLWASIAFGIVFGIVIAKRVEIFGKLYEPAEGRLSPFESGLPIVLGLADGFMAVIWMGVRLGLIVSLPILAIGVMHLIKPWFRPRIYWYTVALLSTSFVAAIVSSIFVYTVILPVAITWLLKFTSGIANPLITLDYYVTLLTVLILAMTVVFQLPALMFIFTKVGAMKYRHWKRMRIVAYGIAFVFSALISPGFDLSTATSVLVPFMLMFESGMFLSWLVNKEEGNYLWFNTIGYHVTRPYKWVRNVMLTHLGI
jgi:sec-independent protein translocase protein TatC